MSTDLPESMKETKTLQDVAKEIFGNVAVHDPSEMPFFQEERPEDYPDTIDHYIQTAKSKFFTAGKDEFQISIELSRNRERNDTILESDMKMIKPLFATAYLEKSGIKNTEVSMHMVNKLVNINQKNIEVQTKEKGFLDEKIVVKQNPTQFVKGPSKVRSDLTTRTDIIRKRFKKSWSTIDRIYPKTNKYTLPDPYKPYRMKVDSIQAIEETKIPYDRCQSTLPKFRKKDARKEPKTPFTTKWLLLLSRSEVDSLILNFIDRFDFTNYLQLPSTYIKDCVSLVRTGLVPRLLYHTIKYLHSIFVLRKDNISHFIRLKAIWLVLYRTLAHDQVKCKFLSVIMAALKTCTHALFYRRMNVEDDFIESTLYAEIDELFDPLHVILSIDQVESFDVPDTTILRKRHGQRVIDDIALLFSNKAFIEISDNKIAHQVIHGQSNENLMNLLGNESWGDHADYDSSNKGNGYKPLNSMTVQNLIAAELISMNVKYPRPPPQWMKSDFPSYTEGVPKLFVPSTK